MFGLVWASLGALGASFTSLPRLEFGGPWTQLHFAMVPRRDVHSGTLSGGRCDIGMFAVTGSSETRDVRLFVLGAPCSGKTTIAVHLRRAEVPVIDTDDEVHRLNGGVWPDIETKNDVLLPIVLDTAASMSNVVLFNSYMPLDRTRILRARGLEVVLLEVSDDELRRRDRTRLAEEGWTNREWFDWHPTMIQHHRDAGLLDHVVDGERDAASIAADRMSINRARP